MTFSSELVGDFHAVLNRAALAPSRATKDEWRAIWQQIYGPTSDVLLTLGRDVTMLLLERLP